MGTELGAWLKKVQRERPRRRRKRPLSAMAAVGHIAARINPERLPVGGAPRRDAERDTAGRRRG